jgi:putative PIN family toxin of toxin-antitoxin system
MRFVILDTNVLVSAGLKLDSVPIRLVMDGMQSKRVQFVTCPSIISEYREVLWRPKFMRHGFPPKWLEYLIKNSLQLADPTPWPHAVPDRSDAPFLALANASGAWLVTGNLKHFPQEARCGVIVLSPTEYSAHLGEES